MKIEHNHSNSNPVKRPIQGTQKTQKEISNEWCTLKFTVDDPSLLKNGGGAMQLQTILLWSFFFKQNELWLSRTATLRDREEQSGTVNGKNTEPDIETMFLRLTRKRVSEFWDFEAEPRYNRFKISLQHNRKFTSL